jgi:hypothetical protein
MLPGTPSTIAQARSAPWAANARSSASSSLNGTTIVPAVTAAGTPGDDGIPSVASPDPASASSASTWPW